MAEAEETKPQTCEEVESDQPSANMDLEQPPQESSEAVAENGTGKRDRGEEEEVEDGEMKKSKVDLETEKSVEEERLQKLEQEEEEKDAKVILGPKVFGSSKEMFDYFYKLLHSWTPDLDINKYEHMVLQDLLNKGHSDPSCKIGNGIQAFQVRNHPAWKSRCFFLVRVDGSSDDFSFRKCVDKILPLPDNMKSFQGNRAFSENKNASRQKAGGRGGRGRRGRF